MTEHFVTAYGCERYISNLMGDAPLYYRIPISGPVHYGEPTFANATDYAYRLFEKVDVDFKRGLVEYREKLLR